MRLALIVFLVLSGLMPARAGVVESAFDRAIAQFEAALPKLQAELFGVDTAAYRDALTLRNFASRHWGGRVELKVREGSSDGSCARFAAFVRLPPENGTMSLILCPQFSTEGADSLRTLTILHEMVHVVAGPNECRAMAFAAEIERLSTGAVTPVDVYWQTNGCDGSGFRRP
ncbi:hypothetical protein VW35_09090 [Devosia soli]|uniref:Lysine-specific metallo-endopeptidase domain-containing protein n=1 Tax=Devosia soli TaxID=361041 RepID=A0A0F5L8U5_9HYPH|nr:hypothetical protein [Devosia soli]KKB78670.1 hypothetical protein VW35_09090 [Devosia soli]